MFFLLLLFFVLIVANASYRPRNGTDVCAVCILEKSYF